MKQTFEIEVDDLQITEVLISSLLREVFESTYTIHVKEITNEQQDDKNETNI